MFCFFTAILTLCIINIYSYFKIRSITYSTKEQELLTATSDYSTSLSDYGEDSISVFANVDFNINKRIIVTDSALNITYDSSKIENKSGSILIIPSTITALSGTEAFNITTSSNTVESCASAPYYKDGKIIGTVSIFESDNGAFQILSTYRKTMLFSSIVIFISLLALAFIVSHTLKSRFSKLTASIKSAQNDEVFEKIEITQKDEIAPVISEFNKIYEQLSYTQKMRQAFVSDASHELRTPLTAIKLLCESIMQADNIDSETIHEFMEDIVSEVDRMSHTAEKLLVLSKLDSGTTPPIAPISLTESVQKAIANLEPIAMNKNVTIEHYLEDNCFILSDLEATNQIVSNLIDNAIKYNKVDGHLRIYLFSKNGKCTFITADTGIGISPEYRERVFERFYRIDKARKYDGRGGSGLGLSIVKRNVETFGGTISIADSVHGGTRFTVVFPSFNDNEGGF